MKESVIMGERQKETLSPNNYFGGGKGGAVEIKTFSLASYVLITSSAPSCAAREQL